MIRDGTIYCDACQATISRVSGAPPEGWERLHNLCSRCFALTSKKAV
jgi:hypothetical protein